MDMGMMLEVLTPGAQDGGDADAEQQSVDLGLVLVGDRADCGRQREHYVEVRHRQQFGLARCKPCRSSRPLTLGTVPIAAGVIADARVGTVFAALAMTPYGCLPPH